MAGVYRRYRYVLPWDVWKDRAMARTGVDAELAP
jgi:hypothetical protein